MAVAALAISGSGRLLATLAALTRISGKATRARLTRSASTPFAGCTTCATLTACATLAASAAAAAAG